MWLLTWRSLRVCMLHGLATVDVLIGPATLVKYATPTHTILIIGLLDVDVGLRGQRRFSCSAFTTCKWTGLAQDQSGTNSTHIHKESEALQLRTWACWRRLVGSTASCQASVSATCPTTRPRKARTWSTTRYGSAHPVDFIRQQASVNRNRKSHSGTLS